MIVLDTHVWIWLVSEPERLSPGAKGAIDYADRLGVCPMSCWEISTKAARGNLSLDREVGVWVRQALAFPRIRLLNLTAAIAVLAGQLGKQGLHGDPADRLIVASAMVQGAELVSKDQQIRSFSGVRTVW